MNAMFLQQYFLRTLRCIFFVKLQGPDFRFRAQSEIAAATLNLNYFRLNAKYLQLLQLFIVGLLYFVKKYGKLKRS